MFAFCISVSTPGPATWPNSLRWFNTALVADLPDATAATINDLRLAFQTQKLYERDAGIVTGKQNRTKTSSIYSKRTISKIST